MAKIASTAQKLHARKYLERIGAACAAGKTKSKNHYVGQYLNSYDCKIVAVERAYRSMKLERRPDLSQLSKIAQELDAWRGTKEPVHLYLKPKASNPEERRPIMDFGIENRALQYLTLPLLRRLCSLHPCQHGNCGGVPIAITKAVQAMNNGLLFGIEVDIKDCYLSFDGKKLPSLIPLPKEVTNNVLITQHLNVVSGNLYELFGPADDDDGEALLATDALADARRGIPQGSAASSFVAETLLAWSLAHVPPKGTVGSYGDNALLLASTESNAVSMMEALWSALQAHPVGRLRPKAKLFKAGDPIDFLGHRLTPKNGRVHIAPTPFNQKKFERAVQAMTRRMKSKNISPNERAKVTRNLDRYLPSWTAAFKLCDGIDAISGK